MKVGRKNSFLWGVLITALLCLSGVLPGYAEEAQAEASGEQQDVQKLDDVVVEGKGGAPGLGVSPLKTVIEVDKFIPVAPSDSVLDLLQTQAAIDFRGENDLDPGVDTIYLNGFDSTRFVTAMDGMTIQKTGGRKSSNIVDYSMLPAFLVEKIEILPGPHSAMYDAKAIGGVLNFISKAPKRRDSVKPDIGLSTSYSSYNTQNSTASVQGAVSAFTYDFAYQLSSTDGYLRHSQMEKEILYGRFGFVLPGDGFITLSTSLADVNRDPASRNDPTDVNSRYDADYPIVESTSYTSTFNENQDATWDSTAKSYRLHYEQSLPIGRLAVGAFYGENTRDRAYYSNIGKYDPAIEYTLNSEKSHMDTSWWQEGGKITDEISWSPNHTTTVGYDLTQMYDDGLDDSKTKRIQKKGYFLQHRWAIAQPLELKVGARYEDMSFWYTDSGEAIERDFDDWMPKSFLTWKMGHLASWMRDTSLSIGVSKIWHAADAHGTYNAQGRPIGESLGPESGMGYDLILARRLWRDISLQADYSIYLIDDYMQSGENLEGTVERNGLGVELGGYMTDDLSFYLSWAWQNFDYDGPEASGQETVDERAEHRVGAGLRYALAEDIMLMADYSFQGDEITEDWVDKVVKDTNGDGELGEGDETVSVFDGTVKIPAYDLFDIGMQYTLFKKAGRFHDGALNFYVKNLFDKKYCNSLGWESTGTTLGAGFKVKI